MAHRQVKLFPECRCVGLVGGRRNSVRHRTAVAPPGPYVTNARATALRRMVWLELETQVNVWVEV